MPLMFVIPVFVIFLSVLIGHEYRDCCMYKPI
jgi:hypothetical protein